MLHVNRKIARVRLAARSSSHNRDTAAGSTFPTPSLSQLCCCNAATADQLSVCDACVPRMNILVQTVSQDPMAAASLKIDAINDHQFNVDRIGTVFPEHSS